MCALSTLSKSLFPGVCRGRGLASSAESTSSCHGEAWESSVKVTVRSLSLGLCDRNMEPGVWQSTRGSRWGWTPNRKFPVSVVCAIHSARHRWLVSCTQHLIHGGDRLPGTESNVLNRPALLSGPAPSFQRTGRFFCIYQGLQQTGTYSSWRATSGERRIERFDVPSQC